MTARHKREIRPKQIKLTTRSNTLRLALRTGRVREGAMLRNPAVTASLLMRARRAVLIDDLKRLVARLLAFLSLAAYLGG